MENDDLPRDKAALMALIARHRADLEQAVGRMSEAQLAAPGDDGWSVKDHLTHIAAWERSLVALLRGQPRGEPLGLDAVSYRSLDTDKLNDIILERGRQRSLAEVLADFAQAHRAVLDELGRLSDADLLRPYAHYQPDTQIDEPVVGWIAGNTYEHYQEHWATIQSRAAGG